MIGAVPALGVDRSDEGAVVLIALRGTLDLDAYEAVRVDLVRQLRADERDIVVDLGGVDFLDSTGLRLLVEFAALASRDRRRCVVVVAHDSPLRRIFAISGTDEVLELVPDVDTARARLA